MYYLNEIEVNYFFLSHSTVHKILFKICFIPEQDTCSLPVVQGDCHNYTERWYYDVYEGRCKPFYYGGCGGNQNKFNSEIECQRHCDHNYITSPVPPVTFTTGIVIINYNLNF